MSIKADLVAIAVIFVAVYAAYFFIRHSFIIVSLAPVLGVLVVAVLLSVGYIWLRRVL